MTVYFDRLKVGYPDEYEHPDDWLGCWRVYTVCKTPHPYSCTTRSDARNMQSAEDLEDARRSWGKFLQRAHTGEPFQTIYDETQCHPAHEFKYGESATKIWRVWGSGKIRIYFLYAEEKRVIVLKTEAKRKRKLTAGEKKHLEEIAITVLDCIAVHTFTEREI